MTGRTQDQDHGSAMHRALGAVTLAAFMLVHLQDWFAGLTTAFTAGFLVLVTAAVALAGLSRRHAAAGARPSRFLEWGARAAGALAVGGLMLVHLHPGWHTTQRLALVGAVAAALCAAALVAGRFMARPAICVAAAAFTLMLTTPIAYQGTPFFWPRDQLFAVTAVSTFALLAAASLASLRTWPILAIVIAASAVMRHHAIAHHEIDAVHRDMLPLVEYAGEALLAGRNPYSMLFWANHDLPLTYLPVMWMSYLPALAAGIDIRWTSVVATAVIAVLVMRWGSPSPVGPALCGPLHRAASVADLARELGRRIVAGTEQATSARAGFAMVAVTFVLVPEVFWNSVHGEPIVYWMWLVVFLDAVRSGSRARAAVALALVIGSRHFGVLFIPFAAMWMVLDAQDYRRGAFFLLLAGALSCAIVMPFFVGHPDSFLYGTYDWLVSYGPSRRTWWDVQIGLQRYFYHANAESRLGLVQLAGYGAGLATAMTLATWALTRRLGGAVRDLWIFLPLAPAYAAFIMFNSMIWKSFLFPVMLLPVFAAGLGVRREVPVAAPPGPAMRRLLEPRTYYPVMVVLAAAIAWSAGTAGKAWRAHRDLTDVGMWAQHVAARYLVEGDLFVDWSVVRAGHVQATSMFEGLYLPAGVRTVSRMRSVDLTAHEQVVLFDGFSRFDPDLDFADLERVTSRRMGRSSLHVFRPPHVMGQDAFRLSARPDAVVSVHLMGDLPPSLTGRREGQRWVFDGRPAWNHVGPVDLRVQGLPMRAIWAHPTEGTTLRIEIEVPLAGQGVLVTALDDFAVRPLHAPVALRVLPGGDEARAVPIVSPNLTGRWFWGLGRLDAGKLVVEVRTDKEGMRHFGFDLLVGP